MSALVKFAPSIGVAPGTTTIGLGGARRWDMYQDMISLNDGATFDPTLPFTMPVQDRPIRWDLVAIVGGGSAIVALTAALIAAAFARR